jgi:hypothetical protein
MVQSADRPELRAWLADLYAPDDVTDDEANAPILRWLRRYFEAEGSVPAEIVWDAFLAHQVALANEAVTAVLADLDRTSTFRATALVDVAWENTIRITINNGYTTPSMFAVERPEALAEVADYFQEQLDQELRCWPVCDRHDFGLHAEVHEGTAVWWCRPMRHTVATIGSLGLQKRRPGSRS